MKLLDPTLTLVAVALGITLGSTIAYHRDQNDLNRKAYYECLRVTEEIAKSDDRHGVRIVSTPNCNLR